MTKTLTLIGLLITAICGMLVIGYLHRTGPQAKELVWNDATTRIPVVPLAIDYGDDYAEPAAYAIRFWNDVISNQELFTLGGIDVVIVGVSSPKVGETCGKFSIHETEGHSATTYECKDGTYEIHIAKPGDLHTMLCIIAHELGHILGLADDDRGNRVMNQQVCPVMIQLSDKDRAAVIERYRRE